VKDNEKRKEKERTGTETRKRENGAAVSPQARRK
jgi:hypothetical protein